MRRQVSDNRRTGMPITAALEGKRGDRTKPEERLAEHLGSVRGSTRSLSVRGQLEGKLGKRAYGRLLDQLETRTRKPRRRNRSRRPAAQ